jgi:hypothetical protein
MKAIYMDFNVLCIVIHFEHVINSGSQNNTNVIISPRIGDSFGCFLGTRYSSIPANEYDFIFIDGPDPEGGINIDALILASNQSKPVDVLIDGRFRAVSSIESHFPEAKISKFINNMTFISGISMSDYTENNFSHMRYKQNFFSLICSTI